MSALAQGLNSEFLRQDVPPQVPTRLPGGLFDWTQPAVPRKAPRREGSTSFEITQGRAFLEQGFASIVQDVEELKRYYVFADDSVGPFLEDHRALSGLLREAIRPLQEAFGADKVLSLEVSVDEDDSRMIYGVILWSGTVRGAAQAFNNFTENWWLNHMTHNTSDLAFIYRVLR